MRLLLESRLWTGLKLIVLLQFLGSAGYFVIGQLHRGLLEPHLDRAWSVLDCVYMTVITISTIGYGEVFSTPPGTTMEDFPLARSYTIALILVAMILVAYASPYGKTLSELDASSTEGLPVLAVKLPGSEFLFNPSDATPLAKGMEIVTMGEISRVQELMKRIGDTTAPTILGAIDEDDVEPGG